MKNIKKRRKKNENISWHKMPCIAIFFGVLLLFGIQLPHGKMGMEKGIATEYQQKPVPIMTDSEKCINKHKRVRYLLLDSRIVEKSENAVLNVGTVEKHPDNPLFIEDKPWEKRFDNFYGNAIFDEKEKLYKCWYSPFIIDHSSQGMTIEQRKRKYIPPPGREMGICYATSHDGLTWVKPDLGVVEFNGSMENNIIWSGPHGAGVFKDLSEPDPNRRYKAFFQGLFVSFSHNGINWSQKKKIEGIKVAGDTHNNAFWAPTLKKYVGITRTFGDLGRQVTRIESNDFINWSKEEVVLKGEKKNLQPYSMPVFFYGGVYLGLVAIHNQETDRVWTELAWSQDTRNWTRISHGTPLIPCSETELDYDYGCVYACANPIFLKDEIRLYYGGSDWLHFGWRNGSFCLATLRPDGFAGYIQESTNQQAVITTTLIPYSGETFRINADIENGGSVKISIMDDEGKLIVSNKQISKTMINSKLKLGTNIKSGIIKIKFEFNKAKLYSFWFDE